MGRLIDVIELKKQIVYSNILNDGITLDDLDQIIDEVPTIEPERKTGKWIDYSEDGYVECPFCHSTTNCDDNIDELHFCFSCGARMSRSDWTTTEEMSGWIKEVNE